MGAKLPNSKRFHGEFQEICHELIRENRFFFDISLTILHRTSIKTSLNEHIGLPDYWQQVLCKNPEKYFQIISYPYIRFG